jgi:hypothetical protein
MKPLDELLDAALQAQDELAAASSQPSKLTAEAFIKAALNVPGANQKQANLILDEIDAPENRLLLPSFRRLVSKIIEPHCTAPWPLLGPYIDAEADSVLGRLRATRESFFLAAVQHAAAQFPQRFGTCEEPHAGADLVASLRTRRDDAVAELAAALQPLIRLDLVSKRIIEDAMSARRAELRKLETAKAA